MLIDEILSFIKTNPDKTVKEIAYELNRSLNRCYTTTNKLYQKGLIEPIETRNEGLGGRNPNRWKAV